MYKKLKIKISKVRFEVIFLNMNIILFFLVTIGLLVHLYPRLLRKMNTRHAPFAAYVGEHVTTLKPGGGKEPKPCTRLTIHIELKMTCFEQAKLYAMRL